MSITSALRPFFLRRVKAARRNSLDCEAVQRAQLARLLSAGQPTFAARELGFLGADNYEDYRNRVKLSDYTAIRPLVERMIAGERDILWPGVTRNFAQSSGTSDGKSKYIPITAESFRRNHYAGGFDVVAHYLSLFPDSRMFDGKGFILGGSFANELSLPKGVVVGDLSANLIDHINPLVNLVRIPSKRVALMEDWKEKLPALVKASLHENVTNLSGVPSWFLTVLREVLREAGASRLHDVWPNLEVFFHGGIAFDPYREQYNHIIDPSRMRYLETYNASEGFFAVQNDVDDHGLLLLLDIGVFYEFVPIDEAFDERPRALAAWEVEEGATYALVITACNGLWRYKLGDTVTVTSVNPLKIIISGRTKHFINAFGEELMVHNADAAITATCEELGCEIANYTAAPVYVGDHTRGSHQWLVEFALPPKSIDEFAATLDRRLRQENSDYDAKRAGDIFLDPLSVTVAPAGAFDRWLAATGKLGGQRKVPRLCNDRRFIDPILELINLNHKNTAE